VSVGLKPRLQAKSPSGPGALHGWRNAYHGSALPTELRGRKNCPSVDQDEVRAGDVSDEQLIAAREDVKLMSGVRAAERVTLLTVVE